MTHAIIRDFKTWEKQNVVDCIEYEVGTLIDNYIFECKHGIAFMFEKSQNEWSSVYEMFFFRFRETDTAAFKSCKARWDELVRDTEEYINGGVYPCT